MTLPLFYFITVHLVNHQAIKGLIMKVIYIGANCRTGRSEKNGRDYQIAILAYLIPDESGQKKSENGNVIWTYEAFGGRVREIPLKPEKLALFQNIKSCSEVDLILEPDPTDPSRNMVVGAK